MSKFIKVDICNECPFLRRMMGMLEIEIVCDHEAHELQNFIMLESEEKDVLFVPEWCPLPEAPEKD